MADARTIARHELEGHVAMPATPAAEPLRIVTPVVCDRESPVVLVAVYTPEGEFVRGRAYPDSLLGSSRRERPARRVAFARI